MTGLSIISMLFSGELMIVAREKVVFIAIATVEILPGRPRSFKLGIVSGLNFDRKADFFLSECDFREIFSSNFTLYVEA